MGANFEVDVTHPLQVTQRPVMQRVVQRIQCDVRTRREPPHTQSLNTTSFPGNNRSNSRVLPPCADLRHQDN